MTVTALLANAAFWTTLGTLGASVLSLIQSRENSKKIQEVHVQINSRLSELLKSVEQASYAKGHLQGTQEQVDLLKQNAAK